jgi:hypothetical protein
MRPAGRLLLVSLEVLAAEQDGHAAAGIERHGVAVTRARHCPRGWTQSPAWRRRIPLPCVLLGDAVRISLVLLHSAEQDGPVALAVPYQRGIVAGAGRGGGSELDPCARCGIPFPGVAKRQRDAAPIRRGLSSARPVSWITVNIVSVVDPLGPDGRTRIGKTAPKEQHLARGFLEHHAVLTAGAWPRTGAVRENAASRIPFPGVREVVAGVRAPAEDDELLADRIVDHARTYARTWLAAGWGAVGPLAGRRIPLPEILKRYRGPARATEYDEHLAGLVHCRRLHIARVGHRW